VRSDIFTMFGCFRKKKKKLKGQPPIDPRQHTTPVTDVEESSQVINQRTCQVLCVFTIYCWGTLCLKVGLF